jgi:hypothetical protein
MSGGDGKDSRTQERLGGGVDSTTWPASSASIHGTPSSSSISHRGEKREKIKPLKVGYLNFKEGNLLQRKYRPRFCILNKKNELEAYVKPEVRFLWPVLDVHPTYCFVQDQSTGNKYCTISDLHTCEIVDIEDRSDGYCFAIRLNKTVHEFMTDTKQGERFLCFRSIYSECISSLLLHTERKTKKKKKKKTCPLCCNGVFVSPSSLLAIVMCIQPCESSAGLLFS